jgi:hypothetical protein
MLDSQIPVLPAPQISLVEMLTLADFRDTSSRCLLFADGTMPPSSLETHVRGFWNGSSLIALFAGRFLGLRTTSEEAPAQGADRTPQLWDKSDVYEVMIGRGCARTGRYKEFQVALDGRWFAADICVENGRVITDDSWEVSIQRHSSINGDEKIWKAALEIPWDALGGFKGEGEWHCNFYRATGKFHGDELLSWRPTGYGDHCFHRPHLFGSIMLVESAPVRET